MIASIVIFDEAASKGWSFF